MGETTTRGPMEDRLLQEFAGTTMTSGPLNAYTRFRAYARERDAERAALIEAYETFERGLMEIIHRADTDPTNLPAGMLAGDFRGIAHRALSRGRAAKKAAQP